MDYKSIANQYATQYGIDPNLFSNIINQESSWNPQAVSPVGAQGLGQVMPDTARQPGFGVTPLSDPFDPNDNLRFSGEYFSKMMNRYDGDTNRALAAYNWGAGNADKWDGNLASLPEETRNYITKINGGMVQDQQGALTGATTPQVDVSTLPPSQAVPDAIQFSSRGGQDPAMAMLNAQPQVAQGQQPPMLAQGLPSIQPQDPLIANAQDAIAAAEAQQGQPQPAPQVDPMTGPNGQPTDEFYANSPVLTDVPPPPAPNQAPQGQPQQPGQGALSQAPIPQSPEEAEEFARRGSIQDILGLGNAEGGGMISRALGWDQYTPDQRDDRWLAIGQGLLSANNWAEGGANVAGNVLAVNQADRDNAFRLANMSSGSSGGTYNRPFNIVGRDADGYEVVRSGTLIGGVPHMENEAGEMVPASSILNDVRIGGRSESQDVVMGPGGIPNASGISESGIPQFYFARESEQKTYGYAIRAIGAYKDMENMIASASPKEITTLRAGLERWAASNANASVTGAVLNDIIDGAGIQGQFAATSRAFLQAVLRADTGAAYTGTEIADYAGVFLPAPGDNPQEVAQKKVLMERELMRFAGTTGSAAPYLAGVIDGTYQLPGGYWQAESSPQPQTGDSSEIEDILKLYE